MTKELGLGAFLKAWGGRFGCFAWVSYLPKLVPVGTRALPKVAIGFLLVVSSWQSGRQRGRAAGNLVLGSGAARNPFGFLVWVD